MDTSRRLLLASAPVMCAATLVPGLAGMPRAFAVSRGPAGSEPWPEFPRQRPEIVREFVGAAHRDINRVTELLDAHPALVNAAWDWGYGDWETALGAAAHTGRRSIADLLLSRGARPDLFAAAMLGHTAVLRAIISASPGIERTPGPHGITLLAHARAGGEAATDAAAYLESLPGADERPPTQPLDAEQMQEYVGRDRGDGSSPVFADVALSRTGDLTLAVNGATPAFLRYAGDDRFFPSGAPAVRVAFTRERLRVCAFSIIDHETVFSARLAP